MSALGLRATSPARAPQPQRRVGGALARLPGAADRAPQRLVDRLAGKEQPLAHRLHQHLAPGWPFTAAAENAPSAHGSLFQRVACVLPIAFFTSAPNRSASHDGREIRHRGFAGLGKLRAEFAGDLDHRERRAGHVREQRGGFRSRRLLEHQIVIAQLQRIALQLQRHMIVAAERQLRDRIDAGASADRA